MDISTLAVARQQFAQSVFNHKIQEVASERKQKYADRFNKVQIGLTLVVLAILALQASGVNATWLNIVGIVSAVADLAFLIIDQNYGFQKQADKHKSYALKFLWLRDNYLGLIGDIVGTKGKSAANIARRDALNDSYQMLTDAPATTYEDYIETQKRLGTDGDSGGEQYTWSDKEINSFLPSELRKKK